jgi:hypothetical protein
MRRHRTLAHIAIIIAGVALFGSGAFAETQQPDPPAQPTAVAQAAPAPAPAKESAKPADQGAIPERVTTLERENVVLREDLGRARLDARSDLEALAKRQAEAIARLNQQVADAQAKLEAEQAKRERQNRNLWTAVGVVALGLILSN